MIACICDVAAMIDRKLRALAHIVNIIADLFFHLVSGCMTAQVAYEMDYQLKKRSPAQEPLLAQAIVGTPVESNNVKSIAYSS
jgi:hypothetical protein